MRQDQTAATETIEPRWSGTAIVAATGPSLTREVAEKCRGHNCIAVSDAYKLLPFAQVLYSCDTAWWRHHKGCPDFAGERWSSHAPGGVNDKAGVAKAYGVKLVSGKYSTGFSCNPAMISYGSNSGFQAVNLAILFGATRILLVGFDMRPVGGKMHFFGEHPKGVRRHIGFNRFIGAFNDASRNMPEGVTIINCTRGSALKAFPFANLDEVLNGTQTGSGANERSSYAGGSQVAP